MNFKLLFLPVVLFLLLPVELRAESYALETDSASAIRHRTEADFPYTVDEFYKLVRAERPDYTRRQLDSDIASRRIETKVIDGRQRVFRKALRNMKLMNKAASPRWNGRGAAASDARISYVDSVLDFYAGRNPLGLGHSVNYTFSIDVPVTEEIAGDTIRVWMPLPISSSRQKNVKIISSFPDNYTLSADRSVHNSIYFEQVAGSVGDTARFEYSASFDTFGAYFAPDFILKNLRDYDRENPDYKKYTAFDSPHIVRLDSLARVIAGKETNPFRLSEKVFDYIVEKYPWAGAREYSTIECIPEYVIAEGHGDCGQVALLYISLMRTLGIPARWESGWMLHPAEKNLHDWAEVYFEGIGWIPVDVSFGRYKSAKNRSSANFYSTGIDAHRLAANRGIGGPFYPPKKFVRSETVDAQMGEVETSHGNLFYPAWNQTLRLDSVKPIEPHQMSFGGIDAEILPRHSDRFGLISIPVASIRTEPRHGAEISTQAVLGIPVKILSAKGEWLSIMTPEGYTGWVPDSSVYPLGPAEFDSWRRADNRRIVNSLHPSFVYTDPVDDSPRSIVSDLVLGSIIEVDPDAPLSHNPKGRIPVRLPDGRRGWTDALLISLDDWAAQSFDADKILSTAYSMMGTPYLWGGMSTKALDCSGLVKVCYFNNGLILRRDASQQARTGAVLDHTDLNVFQPADLLFFGNESTGKITHVGLYDSDSNFIHSSGRVKQNNLNPDSVNYLYSPIKAVRINGFEGTDGIIRASDHPWFFLGPSDNR